MRIYLILLALSLIGCAPAASPKLEKTLPVPKIAALVGAPDDSAWAVGCQSGEVHLYDGAGQALSSPVPPGGAVEELAFGAGLLAYAGKQAPILHIWDLKSKQEILAWQAGDLGKAATRIEHHAITWVHSSGHTSNTSYAYVGGKEAGLINRLAWLSPARVLVNDYRGSLRVLDIQTHEPGADIGPRRSPGSYGFDRVTVSPDGAKVAVSKFGGGELEVFDVNSGRSLFRDQSLQNIHGLAFTPEGGKLAVAAGSKVVLFQLDLGVSSGEWKGSVSKLHFSPDGKWLVAAGNSSFIWEVASQKEVVHLGGCSEVELLGNRPLAVALFEHGTSLIDLTSGKKWEIPGDFRLASSSHDGRKLWLASADQLQLWSIP